MFMELLETALFFIVLHLLVPPLVHVITGN